MLGDVSSIQRSSWWARKTGDVHGEASRSTTAVIFDGQVVIAGVIFRNALDEDYDVVIKYSVFNVSRLFDLDSILGEGNIERLISRIVYFDFGVVVLWQKQISR